MTVVRWRDWNPDELVRDRGHACTTRRFQGLGGRGRIAKRVAGGRPSAGQKVRLLPGTIEDHPVRYALVRTVLDWYSSTGIGQPNAGRPGRTLISVTLGERASEWLDSKVPEMGPSFRGRIGALGPSDPLQGRFRYRPHGEPIPPRHRRQWSTIGCDRPGLAGRPRARSERFGTEQNRVMRQPSTRRRTDGLRGLAPAGRARRRRRHVQPRGAARRRRARSKIRRWYERAAAARPRRRHVVGLGVLLNDSDRVEARRS